MKWTVRNPFVVIPAAYFVVGNEAGRLEDKRLLLVLSGAELVLIL